MGGAEAESEGGRGEDLPQRVVEVRPEQQGVADVAEPEYAPDDPGRRVIAHRACQLQRDPARSELFGDADAEHHESAAEEGGWSARDARHEVDQHQSEQWEQPEPPPGPAHRGDAPRAQHSEYGADPEEHESADRVHEEGAEAGEPVRLQGEIGCHAEPVDHRLPEHHRADPRADRMPPRPHPGPLARAHAPEDTAGGCRAVRREMATQPTPH
nr:hypothetical protein [Herbiconiux ginsengi]